MRCIYIKASCLVTSTLLAMGLVRFYVAAACLSIDPNVSFNLPQKSF